VKEFVFSTFIALGRTGTLCTVTAEASWHPSVSIPQLC